MNERLVNKDLSRTVNGIFSLKRAGAILAVHERFGVTLTAGPISGEVYPLPNGSSDFVPPGYVYLHIKLPEGDTGKFWRLVDAISPNLPR